LESWNQEVENEKESYYDFETPHKPINYSHSLESWSTRDSRESNKEKNTTKEFDLVDTSMSSDWSDSKLALVKANHFSAKDPSYNFLIQRDMYDCSDSPIYYNSQWATCIKIPSIFEAYMTVLMNTIFKLLILSWVWALLWTLLLDVDRRLRSENSLLQHKIEGWRHQFSINNCQRENLPPKLEEIWNEYYDWINFEEGKILNTPKLILLFR